MYPPNIVYVLRYLDHTSREWKTKVYSKSADAHFAAGLYAHGTEFTVQEARFVL